MTAFSLFSEHLKVTSSLILREAGLNILHLWTLPKWGIPELTVFSPTRPDFTLSQPTPSTKQSRGRSITKDTRWRMSVGGLSGSKLGWQQTTAGLISDNGACYLKIKISNVSQVKHLEIPVLSSQDERESSESMMRPIPGPSYSTETAEQYQKPWVSPSHSTRAPVHSMEGQNELKRNNDFFSFFKTT